MAESARGWSAIRTTTCSQSDRRPSWNEQTRRVIDEAPVDPRQPRFFSAEEFATIGAIGGAYGAAACRPPAGAAGGAGR